MPDPTIRHSSVKNQTFLSTYSNNSPINLIPSQFPISEVCMEKCLLINDNIYVTPHNPKRRNNYEMSKLWR